MCCPRGLLTVLENGILPSMSSGHIPLWSLFDPSPLVRVANLPLKPAE